MKSLEFLNGIQATLHNFFSNDLCLLTQINTIRFYFFASRMSHHDQEFFPCDVKRYDFKEFSYKYLWGLRTYIAKEPINNLEVAKRKLIKLKIAHYSVLVVYYFFVGMFYYFLFKWLGLSNFVQNVFEFLYKFK